MSSSLKSLPSPAFLFFLSCWFLGNGGPQLSYAHITDSIKPCEVLGYSQKLVSPDGRIQLGFVNATSMDHAYLAITYVDDPLNTPMWLANREIAVYGGKGNLTMDAKGKLKVMHDGGPPIPLNVDRTTPNSIATLDNTGNFKVEELNSDGSTKCILWQSFDYPTNVLLPGMKLGINFKTQKKWMLTSWLTYRNPTVGGFSLEWSPEKNGTGQLVIRHRGEIYWVSGVGTSSNFKNFRTKTIHGSDNYNFTYISNEDESSFSYSILNEKMPRWNLRQWGSLEVELGLEVGDETCFGVFSEHGPFSESGCAVQKASCRNENQKFEKKRGSFWNPSVVDANLSISHPDCLARCWNNCSCTGFKAYAKDQFAALGFETLIEDRTLIVNALGCRFYDGKFVEDNIGGNVIYVLVETVNHQGLGETSKAKRWWIWLILATIIALVGIFGLLHLLRKKRVGDEEDEEAILLASLDSRKDGNANEIGVDGKKGHDFKVFSFTSIAEATDNFSEENKLGQGGFGSVYKGKLPEGQDIAVKRLSVSSGQGFLEFKNEVLLISKLQHTNLITLLGCSAKGDEKILIYEYMPNKSLDFFLFDSNRKVLLNWTVRYKIIQGIAQGLLYLHKYSILKIIHRDLKVSNILLDLDFNPKISDFGTAKVFRCNDLEANTRRIVGTYGYMSPEYAMGGNFSEKSDIYSFGVLVLEVVSGQKNSTFYTEERPMSLVGYAWELWKGGRSLELKDSTLVDANFSAQILRCIHVALLCVEELAIDRPAMSNIISMLANETGPLPPPKQIAFCGERSVTKGEQHYSLATVTLSDMDAR